MFTNRWMYMQIEELIKAYPVVLDIMEKQDKIIVKTVIKSEIIDDRCFTCRA